MPAITRTEFRQECHLLSEQMINRKYFTKENMDSVKKIARYNFFSPYKSPSEFNEHALHSIAIGPCFVLATALLYLDHNIDSTEKNVMKAIAQAAAMMILCAILVPLAPVASLLGMISRTVVTRTAVTALSTDEGQAPAPAACV